MIDLLTAIFLWDHPRPCGEHPRRNGERKREKDHPRPCGEHARHALSIFSNLGSPPPMRGTHGIKRTRQERSGITPAHAGNTYGVDVMGSDVRDHPRPCGEHNISTTKCSFIQGSPPPMRGTLRLLRKFEDKYRITPAHAGNTRLLIHPDNLT